MKLLSKELIIFENIGWEYKVDALCKDSTIDWSKCQKFEPEIDCDWLDVKWATVVVLILFPYFPSKFFLAFFII